MGQGSAIIDQIKAVLISDIIGHYLPLVRAGREFAAQCPFHADAKRHLTVVPDKQIYKCFVCGAHGDAIEFVMQYEKLSFKEAVNRLASLLGFDGTERKLTPSKAVVIKGKDQRRVTDAGAIDKAREIYAEAISGAGTHVQSYLEQRGIDFTKLDERIFKVLRYRRCAYYHPDSKGRYQKLGTFPAMVAPMKWRDGSVRAVHITYLDPDQPKKALIIDPETGETLPAKKMRGSSQGCAIRLGPFSSRMAVAEGIETGLSYLLARPNETVWVAGSIGNMAGLGVGEGELHPQPTREGQRLPSVYPDLATPGIEVPIGTWAVTIIKDNDSKDQLTVDALVERFARRLLQRGIMPCILTPPQGKDLNDVVKEAKHGS